MFRLTEKQIDRTIEQRYPFLCVGLALMFLPYILPRGFGFGLLTGFMIFALGIYAFSFRKWRTEPGISARYARACLRLFHLFTL